MAIILFGFILSAPLRKPFQSHFTIYNLLQCLIIFNFLTICTVPQLPGLFNYLVILGSRYPLLFHFLSLVYLIYILYFFCGYNKLLVLLLNFSLALDLIPHFIDAFLSLISQLFNTIFKISLKKQLLLFVSELKIFYQRYFFLKLGILQIN